MGGENRPPSTRCPFSVNVVPGRPGRVIALKNMMDEQQTFTDSLHKQAVDVRFKWFILQHNHGNKVGEWVTSEILVCNLAPHF